MYSNRTNKNLWSIYYIQEGNKVKIKGVNPKDLNDKGVDLEVEFENETGAQGYCLTLGVIESAIETDYPKEFVIAMTGDTVDITTETPLDKSMKKRIEQRIRMTLEVMPIAKKVKFYSV